MARLRLLLIAVLVLEMFGCALLEQQQNFISFTLDGLQYTYTASDDGSGHPYAIGYTSSGEIEYYGVVGSATTGEAAAHESTLEIWIDRSENYWNVQVTLYDGEGYAYYFYLPSVHEDEIDSFIANRDVIGEHFTGSIPGQFWDDGTDHWLQNIIFSAERLPDEPGMF